STSESPPRDGPRRPLLTLPQPSWGERQGVSRTGANGAVLVPMAREQRATAALDAQALATPLKHRNDPQRKGIHSIAPEQVQHDRFQCNNAGRSAKGRGIDPWVTLPKPRIVLNSCSTSLTQLLVTSFRLPIETYPAGTRRILWSVM